MRIANHFLRKILLIAGVVLITAFSIQAVTGFNPTLHDSLGVQTAQAAAPAVFFVPNQGQIDASVDYISEGGKFLTYLNDRGLYFVTKAEQDGVEGRWTTAVEFIDANTGVHPQSSEEYSARMSYFRGSPQDWKTGLQTSSAVKYENLWDDIDLTVEGKDGAIKYTFDVMPQADASQIQLRYSGADISINNQGALELATPAGVLIDERPIATQLKQGEITEVAAEYLVSENGRYKIVTFSLGEYDANYPLEIDPAVYTYASLNGGTSSEYPIEPRLDSNENIVYAGTSQLGAGSMFTGISGFDATPDGENEAYVIKYAADGTSVLWGTYIGGSQRDNALGLAVDGNDDVYLVGQTRSHSTFQVPNEGFPATAGAFDTTFDDTVSASYHDAFLCKIAANGLSLGYCTYLGGDYSDYAWGVDVDSSNRAYVVGSASSTETQNFPVTGGSFDTTFNTTGPHAPTHHNGFAGRFAADGSSLDYLGYIGGANGTGTYGYEDESGWAVKVDASNNAYVVGKTPSDEASFPDGDGFGAVPGYDQTFNGVQDGFVVKINPSGTALLGATYIGGDALDRGFDLVQEANGDILISGAAASDENTFPVTSDFLDATFNGLLDMFVARFNNGLTSLKNAGYIGGSGEDFNGTWGSSLGLDADGNIYSSGWTDSTEATFPVLDGPDLTSNGIYDGVITKLSPEGDIIYSGFLGSTGEDNVDGIVVTDSGEVWLTGTADQATGYPNGYGFYSIPGVNQTQAGNGDGALVRVSVVPATIDIVETGGSTDITEEGPTSDTYSVTLHSQPQSDVTVTIAPNAQQTTDKSSLTFTPLDWDVPQTVTTTAVDDTLVECAHDGLITHTAASSDLNYDQVSVDVIPHITDNEICPTTFERLPGATPVDQSVSVSKKRFLADGSASCAVLARANILVDAFVVGPFVNLADCTLLLTESDNLNSETLAEANRALGDTGKPLYLTGGTEALSDSIQDSLAAAGYSSFSRFAGANRRQTARFVADAIVAQNGSPATKIMLADDSALVDVFSISPVAGQADDGIVEPIMITNRGLPTIDHSVVEFLQDNPAITNVEVIGGEAAVSSAAVDQLSSTVLGLTLTRTAGADRYLTNVAVVNAHYSSPSTVLIARGDREGLIGATSLGTSDKSDLLFSALLSGPLGADLDAPLLIVKPTILPDPIREYIRANTGSISEVIIIGSLSEVSQAVEDEIASLLP